MQFAKRQMLALAFLSVAILALAAVPIQAETLVAYWDLDESAGATAADSVAGNNGAITGSTYSWTTGISGSAVLLGSSDARITVGDSWGNLGAGDFTISAWVKSSGETGGQRLLYEHSPSSDYWGTPHINFDERSTQRKTRVVIYSQDYGNDHNKEICEGSYVLGDTNWHHVVAARDSGVMRLYVDAVEIASYTPSSLPVLSPMVAVWGNSSNPNVDLGFFGALDELQLYTGWIGTDGVAFLYNNPGATIPEPGTSALLATGLIGLLCYAWRKRK